MTTGRPRIRETAAAEVAANARPPTAEQKALIQAQLAPAVSAAASKNDAAKDAAA